MKTNFTIKSSLVMKVVTAVTLLFLGSEIRAQALLKGGQTYWIDGIGVDLVAPKDTFINFNGTAAYPAGADSTYKTTTGILAALNIQGVDPSTLDTVRIIVLPSYTGRERGTLNIGRTATGGYPFMSNQRPILIKPAPGTNVIITDTTSTPLAANGSLVRFNGAQFIVIDGEATPGQRNLTFQLASNATANSTKVIDIIPFANNGCQRITIRNCNIRGVSSAGATATIGTYAGIYLGASTSTPSVPVRTSNFITIQNNVIEASQNPIYIRGRDAVAGGQDIGLIVRNNILGGTIQPIAGETNPTTFIGGSAGAAGITLIAQRNAVVEGNIIRNNLPSAGNYRGIAISNGSSQLALDSNISINANRIYNLRSTAGSTGVYGIRVSLGSHSQPLAIRITNNTIGKLFASSTGNAINTLNYVAAIALEDASANAGISIFHNSVHLYGDTLSSGTFSACLFTASTLTGGLRVANNIFANRLGRSFFASGASSISYIYAINSTVRPFTSLRNNAYFLANNSGSFSFIGFLRRAHPSLDNWKTVTFDTGSFSMLPNFVGVDDTTLTLANGAGSLLGDAGLPLDVLTDINGNLRSTTAPSLGAYEFTENATNANYPLTGGSTYQINGVSNWPRGQGASGSFSTIADAVTYLNTYGVTGTGTVTLQLSTGYTNETSFIPPLLFFPGASANCNVLLRPAAASSFTITTPPGITTVHNNFAVLNMVGARHFAVDGASVTGQRNLTFSIATALNNTTAKVISIGSADTFATTNISIRNCVLIGASNATSIFTSAAIYQGHYNPGSSAFSSALVGGNSNLVFTNNYIQAVRTGIYIRGANIFNAHNRTITISRNLIGGDIRAGQGIPTTYVGGTSNQAGIYLKGVANVFVDSNIVRNSDTIAANTGFRGIELDAAGELTSVDSSVNITRNTIYNLTTAGAFCQGIRVTLGNLNSRRITMINNSIAKIRGVGTSQAASLSNPAGILVESSTSSVGDINMDILNNTIQLSGTTMTGSNSSYGIYIGNFVNGGLRIQGNLISNKLGRTSATAGFAYALFFAGNYRPVTANSPRFPFDPVTGGLLNSNAYGSDAPNTPRTIIGTANSTNPQYNSLTLWQQESAADAVSYNLVTFFETDSTPRVDAAFAGPLVDGSIRPVNVTTDIAGNPRSGTFTNMGALQFTTTFLPYTGGETYLINGVNNFPNSNGTAPFSFNTVNNAIRYLMSNGVDGLSGGTKIVKWVISSGYVGEGDTLITQIGSYPRMNNARRIVLTNAPGRQDTITTASTRAFVQHGSLIRFAGGQNFEIDGSSDGSSTGRNITISLPVNASTSNLTNTLKIIDITQGERVSSNIAIRNCNIIGNAARDTIFTFAGIYSGGVASTPSAVTTTPFLGTSNLVYENNFISGVRYGVYAQGVNTVPNGQDRGLIVRRNIIGRDTAGVINQFGGAANAAGIFLAAQANASVDSNVISNNHPNFIANRGIELFAAAGNLAIDSNISVTRNTITKIRNTTAAGAAYGIYMNFATDSLTRTTVANNMISGISAPGTAATPPAVSLVSPYGIFLDVGTTAINNIGVSIVYNSINLGLGTSLGTTNSGLSSCLGFAANIRGGVTLRNNVLQNRLGRTSGTGNAYTIVHGGSSNIYSTIDNNLYYTLAPNVAPSNQGIAMVNATAATPDRYNTLATWTAFSRQDTMSANFITKFVNDSNLLLDGFQHVGYGWGLPVTGVNTDIQGEVRSATQPTIGADEIPFGTYADSIAPRIYNVTPIATFCNNGPFAITYRVFERPGAVASDTLYYKINGGAEQFIVGATSFNGFTRTYTIPAQPDNTSVAYRLALTDNSVQSLRSTLPVDGASYEYTSSVRNQLPITFGFDQPNENGFTVQNIGPNNTRAEGGWQLDAFGSPLSPVISPNTGVRAALFESARVARGTISRLISPCLDMSQMKVPTLRFWVSQNAEGTGNDRVQVTVSGGFNVWSAPLVTVPRRNPLLAFPEYRQVDVCLSDYVGLTGFRIGIEAVSDLGQNIVLDSIVIFDDVLSDPITPLSATICQKSQLQVSIPSSFGNYKYSLVNTQDAEELGPQVTGTGSPLVITAPNPSKPATTGRVDSVWAVLKYENTFSGCKAYFPDTAKFTIQSFDNGPFVVKGTPFTGSFNEGTLANPDGSSETGVITYEIIPPTKMTVADYGSKWTITSTDVRSTRSSFTIANTQFTPPTGGNNAKLTLTPTLAEVDSVFKITVNMRLLPSNCDSSVVRYLKVVSAPSTAFTNVSDSTCPGVPIYFTNTTTFQAFTAPITYVWDFGDGTTATTKDANKVYSYNTPPGTYTVTLTAFNNAGVSSTATRVIRVLQAPVSSFVSGEACGTDSITFTSTSTGASSYDWTSRLNSQVIGTANTQNAKFSFAIPDTIYNVTLRATNALGCFKDTTIGTFSFSKPIAAFSTTNGCLGLNAVFQNNTTIATGVNGRSNTFGSEWSFGNGAIGLSNNPVYKYPASGTYTVKLKVTSNYGCVDSTQGTIVVYDRPNIGFTTGTACQDVTVALDNTTTYPGGANKVVYEWNFGDNSATSADFEPTKSYGSIGTYQIRLIAVDTVNFCRDTIRKNVTVGEKPIALFAANDGCVGAAQLFNNASIPPAGEPVLTYTWDFGDSQSSTAVNPSHTYASNGNFDVKLVARTQVGCTDTAKKVINIQRLPDSTFAKFVIDDNRRAFVANTKGYRTYKFEFGDGDSENGDSVTNLYQTKSSYTVRLTVTSQNGCVSTSTDTVVITKSVSIEEAFATKFGLAMYPNPFETESNITYNLNEKSDVTVTVMDVLGRVVTEIAESNQTVGSHKITLDESKFSTKSGVYMIRIKIGDDSITKQLIRN